MCVTISEPLKAEMLLSYYLLCSSHCQEQSAVALSHHTCYNNLFNELVIQNVDNNCNTLCFTHFTFIFYYR